MLDLFKEQNSNLPPITSDELSDEEVIKELQSLKRDIAVKHLVLGHHYQSNEVIQFADETGDSLALAKRAAQIDKPYITFCGVHFMAETADMLTSDDQQIILPDLNAGCSMADMANDEQVNKAWSFFTQCTKEKITPITYINCTAELKAFVGSNGGAICTSSNARKVIEWAFKQGKKLLFFPDQHLGRNTCFEMGIPLEDMVVYNPNMLNGGLTAEQVDKAKVILWYGYCSVHQGFTAEQVEKFKIEKPDVQVIVHPECSFDVVQAAHDNGSTSYIIDKIQAAPAGSKFAVGTEINLVNRLAAKFKDKEVHSLSPYQCLCTTMYRVRPRWLLASLLSIKEDKPINVIKVSKEIREPSLIALERMLSIS